jgi:cytochrome P450
LLNPLRPFIQWYYDRAVHSFIRAELQNRLEEIKTERASSAKGPKLAKSVATVAIEDYISQRKGETLHLDENFVKIASNQIRLFLFAGNDTTSSTIVYMFHFLSKNPHALTKLREEHDLVFGSGVDAATKLREKPILLNQCAHTLGVIKETLRLCPPSGSLRYGRAGAILTDRQGNVYPTDGLKTTIMHRFVHRNPRFWPRPEEFLPERWLPSVKPGDELYVAPNTGAYRPFEQGPRNCIGQTLVLNELRVVLILVARTFVITPAYDEWDADKENNRGPLRKVAGWLSGEGKREKTALGERAYQTSKAGGHPADGYPCRVSLAE